MQEWLITTYLLFGCCVLCLHRNAFVFPWVMGTSIHRQWHVSTLSVHAVTLWLCAPFAPPVPAARAAVPSLGWPRAGADLPQPVGCLGAILRCRFGAKGPHNSSGFGLLCLFYRESPTAVQHKVTFTAGRLLLKRTRAPSNSALCIWHWTDKIDPQHLSMSPCLQGFVVVLFCFHITEKMQQILFQN